MTTALSAGLTACNRAMCACATASQVTSPARVARAVSTADHCQIGFDTINAPARDFAFDYRPLTRFRSTTARIRRNALAPVMGFALGAVCGMIKVNR